MDRFSIRDMEALSGIKAHTLRIWEQRYQLIVPKRTDTNIRYYTCADLRLLLNVAVLYNNGYKISKISAMSSGQIESEVLKVTERIKGCAYGEKMKVAMMEFDEPRFVKVLHNAIHHLGLDEALKSVIMPFVAQTGNWWQAKVISCAHEHFVSNVIRRKLFAETEKVLPATQDGQKFLLFLPEHEMHELPLLYLYYKLIANGHRVLYLGQCVPSEALETAVAGYQPDVVVGSITITPGDGTVKQCINSAQEISHTSGARCCFFGAAAACYQGNKLPGLCVYPAIPDLVKALHIV